MSATLSQIKISATRCRGQDRKERAVLLWGDCEWLAGQVENKDALLRDLLDTLEGFQYVWPDRRDMKIWAEYFRRRFKQLTIKRKRKL